jgi:hypothetical protein
MVDLISTRCKVKNAKRVGLAVLLKILTGSAELVKVRQTLSRVGDSFDIKFGMVTDCSFIKLPVGAMELTTWHMRKSISR